MARLPTTADVAAARTRLDGIALRTPLEAAPALAFEGGPSEVRLKREDVQPTGAFKTRGAHNKLGLLVERTPDAKVVTASAGTHAIAVEHTNRGQALLRRGFQAPTVVLPGPARLASPSSNDTMLK
jgi:threonine dehydratase